MPFEDLRQFIDKAREVDRVVVIEDADWDLEIGAITEITAQSPDCPLLLFDKIKGYPPGHRVLSNILNSPRRAALAMEMPLDATPVELIRLWKDRIRSINPIPCREVSWGPVMENVQEGEDIDCLHFPAPKWHERDGGRYIGTADAIIQRDLDNPDWMNVGTYRIQVYDRDTLGTCITPSHHGFIIGGKHWERGEPCPIAITFGQEPALWVAATHNIPPGLSEYDYAGWIRGEPVEVIRGEMTGLPIPATAEIAIEGEIYPPEHFRLAEGPFGEWPGYYASGSAIHPVVKVKRVMFRNNPIITGAPPLKPMATHNPQIALDFGSARLWQGLEDAGVPDVRGVFRYVTGQNNAFFIVIAIKQRYPGHSRQAAHTALGCYTGAGLGRFVITVDEDVDIANLHDVMWTVGTRCDPAAIDIVKDCPSDQLDPRIEPQKRARGEWTTDKAIIDACRPFHWQKDFPAVNAISEGLKAKVLERWATRLDFRK